MAYLIVKKRHRKTVCTVTTVTSVALCKGTVTSVRLM